MAKKRLPVKRIRRDGYCFMRKISKPDDRQKPIDPTSSELVKVFRIFGDVCKVMVLSLCLTQSEYNPHSQLDARSQIVFLDGVVFYPASEKEVTAAKKTSKKIRVSGSRLQCRLVLSGSVRFVHSVLDSGRGFFLAKNRLIY